MTAEHKFPEIASKTCSFGITTYQNGDDTIHLLKRADQALYISKNNGKNQTQIILS
ncbi:diguanylate cyclase domain-containing protein [Thiosulfatimonas sediminis]|uniref:diguanylate cyclase domain-containing protein n=1 Tax=Thiosulfatimonas sediminis TaxID=2675054 RepID=UPI0015677693